MTYSIITATYNQMSLLPKLVEALENQTEKDFEWLICDDGSTDGTKEYIESLNTSFPLRYFRQKNKGMRLAQNVNQGIYKAMGEHCVFIMGDSFPEMNFLETLNDYVGEGKVLCCMRVQVDNGQGVDIDYRIKKNLVPPHAALLLNAPWNAMSGNGLVIPTEAMLTYGGWNEKIKEYGGEDNEIAARLFFKGYTMWSIPEARLYHHYHKSSETLPYKTKMISKMIYDYAK